MGTEIVKLDKLVTERWLADAWGLKREQVKRMLRDRGAPFYLLQKGVVLYDGDELYQWIREHCKTVTGFRKPPIT